MTTSLHRPAGSGPWLLVAASLLLLSACKAEDVGDPAQAATNRDAGRSEAAAATNDQFADRLVIGELPFVHRAVIDEATTESWEATPSCILTGGLPADASVSFEVFSDQRIRSVWYSYQPADDVTVTIDTTRSDFPVVTAITELVDEAPGQEVGCVYSNGPESLTVDLQGGQDYAFQVMRVNDTAPSGYEIRIRAGRTAEAPPVPAWPADTATDPGPGDVTVVAVVDVGLSPYHWDLLSSKMPQALDANPANDLPLDRPPHEWLPGFPSPAAFAAYRPLELSLAENDPDVLPEDLFAADAPQWASQGYSTTDAIVYHWIPGTKVIGALSFTPTATIEPAGGSDHGTGVASAAVGNLNGTCPECLLVFIDVDEYQDGASRNEQLRAAFRWAQAQAWIDVVVSSTASVMEIPGSPEQHLLGIPYPAFVGDPDDVEAQRVAAQRGQTQFQAAGNGLANQFTAANPVVTNSHMGPDWLITVGGVGARGELISGDGLPVDVTAPAIWAPRVSASLPVGRRGFAFGTSYSAPMAGGIYARALYQLRRALPGVSRIQADGVIATGQGVGPECASRRPACELADGQLTADELRQRFLHAAQPSTDTATRLSVFSNNQATVTPPAPLDEEWRLAHEGHGAFRARHLGNANLLAEVARVVAPSLGRAEVLERPAGERDWMIVDSYCRQSIWGEWDGGYHRPGEPTPGPDPAWPVRSLWEQTCPAIEPVPSLPPF